MKTSELTGFALDWAVALALGYKPRIEFKPMVTPKVSGIYICVNDRWQSFRPSTSGELGMAIIGQEDIGLNPPGKFPNGMVKQHWSAMSGKCPNCYMAGPTPLIAAMRCYVVSKLGVEVEIPEELK